MEKNSFALGKGPAGSGPDQDLVNQRLGIVPNPAFCIILPTIAPTTTSAAPTQNIGQLPSITAKVPTKKAIEMIITVAQAAGVDPWWPGLTWCSLVLAWFIGTFNHQRHGRC